MDNLNSLFRIARLVAREREGENTADEKNEIDNWLNQKPGNHSIYNRLKGCEDIYKSLRDLDNIDTNEPFRRIWSRIRKAESPKRKIVAIPRMFKYAAAALLLIGSSVTVYFTVQKINQLKQHQYADIKPGTQKAILVTADNRQIELGRGGIKQLFRNRKLSITDTAHTLTYEIVDSVEVETNEIEYNQVIVPRGGEYTLVLADGSRVKLNSDSRLRFPLTFNTAVRKVELEGEAYLEVTKSEHKPFVVQTNDMKVFVYGTAFNISAYSNDILIHTTLVEGSVGIEFKNEKTPEEITLHPGEQAKFNRQTTIAELREVNVDLYTAWVDGKFMFENEPIGNILKKLSRWYDFEVKFENEELMNRFFTGDLKRYDNISTILDMISIASDLEFTIKENTIIVSETN